MILRAYLAEATRRLRGPPFPGLDADETRTWRAVDATTRSIAYLRNYHEVRCCIGRRLNHIAAEGGEYRGIEP